MPPDMVRRGKNLVVVMCSTGEEVEGVALQAVSLLGHCTSTEEEKDIEFLKTMVRSLLAVAFTIFPSFRTA